MMATNTIISVLLIYNHIIGYLYSAFLWRRDL
jgi:hypothetical protein